MAKAKTQKQWTKLLRDESILDIDSGTLTKEDLTVLMQALSIENEGVINRRIWEDKTGVTRATVDRLCGSFTVLKELAGIGITPSQRQRNNSVSKHVRSDKNKELGQDRLNWGSDYKKPGSDSRWKTVLIGADFHDIECDPFVLRVFLDTIKRISPDNIVMGGDLFDIPEFGKYTCDPRDWDASGRIKFALDHIVKPIREAAGPDVQIDLIEGNHEIRLLNQMCDDAPALMDVLSSIHGMTMRDIFGLDKYEINYIAKSDLHGWSKADERKSVSKNFEIYYDSFMFCHFPEQRAKSGMPGMNGHHHKHQVWPMCNQTFGSYEWHQLGGFHYRDASYADGEVWSNGFMIAHVDTKTKSTVFEYVDVKDHCCVGGQYYLRGRSEHTHAGYKHGK
jgi:hypothetical protein